MRRLLLTVVITILSMFLSNALMAQDLPVVLFDQGHNQRFLINTEGPLQLSALAGIFKNQGFKVLEHSGALDSNSLSGANALIISGAFNTFSQVEIDAVAGFLNNGGNVAIMLHIGPPLVLLLDRLGVVVSNGVLHEQENLIEGDDVRFRVTSLEADTLTADIEQFSLYGGWGLLNEGPGTKVLAKTSPKTWIDLNGDRKLSNGDAVQAYPVIVSGNYGKGRFVVFGDDAIFQNKFLDENNSKLSANLAKWMK